jgi:PAS domain S-box-containing protein
LSLPRLRLQARRVVSRIEALIIAIVAALATAALAWGLHERVPGDQFLFLYMPMVAAVAYLGGRILGFIAWAISVATAGYFLVPPTRSFGWTLLLAVFGAAAAFVVEGAARLRAAEAAAHRFGLLVESSGDAIVSSSFDGIVQTWNRGAERLYGYTSDEAIGRPLTRLLAADRIQAFARLLARGGGGERIEHFETASVTKDGTRIETSVALSPVPDLEGRVVGVSVIARDITERQRAQRWQRQLLDVSERLTSSLDLTGRAVELARSAVPALGDCCAVRLAADDGTLHLAALAHRDPAHSVVRRLESGSVSGVRYTSMPADAFGPARLYPRVDAELHGTMTDAELRELVRQVGAHSMMHLPMRARDRVLGDLVLCAVHESEPYRTQDLAAAEQLAHLAALALDNARLHEELATTLQEALLPGTLPPTPGLRIDTAYRPAAVRAGVGGDWYDAFTLPDGRLTLTVGDVVGHGLDAAVRMGELRHTIRAAALAGHEPADALQVADAVIRSGGGGMATAVILTLDPVTLDYTYAAAGHPPPMIATRERVETLEDRTLPLGLGHLHQAAPEPGSLPRDALLVLYTDGLIEADRDPAAGEAALRAAVAEEYVGRLDQPAHGILQRVIGGRTPPDDIAILTLAVISADRQ